MTVPIPALYFLDKYNLTKFQRAQITNTAKDWGLEFIQLLNLAYWCWRAFLCGEKHIEFGIKADEIDPPYWYQILKFSREKPNY